ncbi:MAG: hypothetical protein O7F16_12805 [Acidobacteria bacterium]|nr:hypothetical protein [Acidobacteriota bacterium]
MRLATLVCKGITGLALSLALLCAGCKDEERVDLILGTELEVVSAPNPVHTIIDPTGTSVITVTVADVVDFAPVLLGNEPVELETMDGSLVPTMGVTGDDMPDPLGKFTSTFSNSTPTLATVTVRANDQEVFYLIEVTDREPEASDPSATHGLFPAAVTVTDCRDTMGDPLEIALDGQLLDDQFFFMQGATIDLEVRGTTGGIGSGVFLDPMDMPITMVTTAGEGLYSAKYQLDAAGCDASCKGAPSLCTITLGGKFMGTPPSPYNSNDVVITTNIP